MIHDDNVARLVNHCLGRRLALLDGALRTQRGLFVSDDPSVRPDNLMGSYRCMGEAHHQRASKASDEGLVGPYDRVACWLGDTPGEERRAVVNSCAQHVAHDGVLVVSGWQPFSFFYQSCRRAQWVQAQRLGWGASGAWCAPEGWGARWYTTDLHRSCHAYKDVTSFSGSNVELTWRWLLPWCGGVFTWYLGRQALPMVLTDGGCSDGQTCREGV